MYVFNKTTAIKLPKGIYIYIWLYLLRIDMTTNKIYVLITMFFIMSSASAAFLFSPVFNTDEEGSGLLSEQHWHYTVPVEVHSGLTERDDRIVSLTLNITKELGGYGEFDENSVRVRETNDTWYPQWDAIFQERWLDDDNLEVSWLMNGTTPANTTRYYTVLFDTLRNGEKEAANDVGLLSDDNEEMNGVSVDVNDDGHLWISGDDYTVKIDIQRGGSRVVKYRDSTRKGYVYDTGWMSWHSDAFNWRTKGAEVNLTAEGPLYAEVEITSGCGIYGYTWSFYPDSMRIRSDNDTHMLSFDTFADNVINIHGTLVWSDGSTEELRMTNQPTRSPPAGTPADRDRDPGPPDGVNPGPSSNETDEAPSGPPSDDDGWLPPGRRYTVHRNIANYFYIIGPEDKERNASAGFWAVTENGLEQTIYCAGEKGLRWVMNGTEAWFGFAEYSRTANVTLSYQYPPSVIRHRTIVKMISPTITNDVHLEGQILYVDGMMTLGNAILPGNGNLTMTDMDVYIDGSMMVWWNSIATLDNSKIHIIEAGQGGRYLYARGELNILRTHISTDDGDHLRVVLRQHSQVHGSTFRNLMNGIEVYSDEVEITNVDIKYSMGAGIIVGKGYSPTINGGTISNCRYGMVIGTEPVNSTYNPPKANFEFLPSNPSVGEIVQFTDTTIKTHLDMTLTWMWDFGDGTTSNEQNPSKSFSSAKKYTVALTVIGEVGGFIAGMDRIEKDIHVGVSTNTVAGFSISYPGQRPFPQTSPNPQTNERVTFKNNSQAATADESYITEWYWEFGDGNTDDSQDTYHYYETPGSYTVRLTVTDDKGRTDTATRSLTVDPRGPVARFNFSPDEPEPGETVQFTDTSSGRDGIGIFSWEWNFGDGSPVETYTTRTHPTHTYDEKGDYSIRLRVEDSAGNSHTREEKITVGTPPVARISEYKIVADLVQDDDGMWRTEIEFDGSESEGEISEYIWKFKNFDGTTTEKTGAEVTHEYESSTPRWGFRFPTLTVTDDAGFTGTTSTRVVFYHPNTIHTYTGLELHNNDIGLRLIREAGDGDGSDLEVGKTITGRNYVNIFDSTIHNNRIGILSEGTHFAIKDTYVFDNDISIELDGQGHRTLMVPVTGAYDRRPEKMVFDNFRSDLYSSKDGDSWSWIEELWMYGTNPYITDDQSIDTDGDGLTNVEEVEVYGTDPLSPDTDGDGLTDDLELYYGSNPLYTHTTSFRLSDGEQAVPYFFEEEEDVAVLEYEGSYTLVKEVPFKGYFRFSILIEDIGTNPPLIQFWLNGYLREQTTRYSNLFDEHQDGRVVQISSLEVMPEGENEIEIYLGSKYEDATDVSINIRRLNVSKILTNPALVDTDGDGIPDCMEENWNLEMFNYLRQPRVNIMTGGPLGEETVHLGLFDYPLYGADDYTEERLASILWDDYGRGAVTTRYLSWDREEKCLGGPFRVRTNPTRIDTDGDGIPDNLDIFPEERMTKWELAINAINASVEYVGKTPYPQESYTGFTTALKLDFENMYNDDGTVDDPYDHYLARSFTDRIHYMDWGLNRPDIDDDGISDMMEVMYYTNPVEVTRKRLGFISFGRSVEFKKIEIGRSYGMYFDIEDLVGNTEEGQESWVTVWLVGSTTVSASVSLDLPVEVGMQLIRVPTVDHNPDLEGEDVSVSFVGISFGSGWSVSFSSSLSTGISYSYTEQFFRFNVKKTYLVAALGITSPLTWAVLSTTALFNAYTFGEFVDSNVDAIQEAHETPEHEEYISPDGNIKSA